MFFPDQSHINRVRDALWQRSVGGASVMVGAGFSRNAEKARPEAAGPPTWKDIAESVCHKLYPVEDDRHLRAALAATSETSGLLRLAQEYNAAFGSSQLKGLIRQLVRDDDFEPGDIHSRLLRLPWRDVFTTNWDTLLEKTCPSVVERTYSIVRNVETIPLSTRPRIVKLHGSLSDHFPLIFTEEDYRTYPIKFAPFVNTVQQAMMETVFCLIGFSGDDPNFLHWSGWVRDNLGDSAPKIYLAGWLDLSTHRRRMLEERNVVPIDLALHPKAAKWPDHLRHTYATEWILHSLEGGRPYETTNWPTTPHTMGLPPSEWLQPVQKVVTYEPKNEPMNPSNKNGQDKSSLLQVQELLPTWEHNRKIYPGWLFAPFDKQFSLHTGTRNWEPLVLEVLTQFTPMEELKAIRELVWRYEILLEPISDELEDAAQSVLNKIDCQARKINGYTPAISDWPTIREAWIAVGLSLVTSARQQFNKALFDERVASLSNFSDDDREVTNRIHYERCLWAIYSLDFGTIDTLLKKWLVDNSDPVWMMRKSALLFETGHNKEARQLIEYAVARIRENPDDDHSLANSSREGWALWSAWAASQLEGLNGSVTLNQSRPIGRWEELTPLKCNASIEKGYFVEALKASQEAKKAQSFDFEMERSPGVVFSDAEYRYWIAARRAVRLTEIAGLPPSIDFFTISRRHIEASCGSIISA